MYETLGIVINSTSSTFLLPTASKSKWFPLSDKRTLELNKLKFSPLAVIAQLSDNSVNLCLSF